MRRYAILVIVLLSVLVLQPDLYTFQLDSRDIHDVYERHDDGFLKGMFSSLLGRETFSKSYAIVIGLSDYSGYWNPLESPYRDALNVRNYLINKAGFDYVVTLTNREATKALIDKYMEEILPAVIGERDRFLFYYSGHGTQRKFEEFDGAQRVRGYLPMLNSGEETWADMISMDDVERWNENVQHAKHVLFVLDACFSGLAGIERKGECPKLYLEDLSKYGHHLITAGTADQESCGSIEKWGGSLFTYAFIKGISGKADAGSEDFPEDGVVSLTELKEYIAKSINAEVARQGGVRQTPQVSSLADNEGEFFFITEKKRLERKGDSRPIVDGAPMVLIPAGEFQMGNDDGGNDEKPGHQVYLDAFYMDVYEVTNARYKRFMDETGHGAPKYWDDEKLNQPDQPVVGVSWDDARAYAEWAGKRLPTEAEWEKAARGGLVGKRYPWGDSFTHDDANYDGTGGKDIYFQTAPVGSFAPNGYGLCDMAGNVWEWCADYYDSGYYAESPGENPTGPVSGDLRVLRGGSWTFNPITLSVAYRHGSYPTYADQSIGIRCVISNVDSPHTSVWDVTQKR